MLLLIQKYIKFGLHKGSQLDTKRKRKPTNPNKQISNKRTKSTKISSLFPKQNDTWEDIQQTASKNKPQATKSKTNTGTIALER